MPVTEDAVRRALARVAGPDMKRDLISSGLVGGVAVDGARVTVTLSVTETQARTLEPLRQAAQRVVGELEGVETALVVMTAEAAPGTSRQTAPAPSRQDRNGRPIQGVRDIIAVASGKGGVGKSTTTANIAVALAAKGQRVGILDADIYGPSQPRLFGVKDAKPDLLDDKRLRPVEAHGIKLMSIGFLVAEGTAMVWRGPMVISALNQMLREVVWDEDGPLDTLLVDMPPGTGDAQLTMSQNVPLSGAIIVSTPQDLALIDARKAIDMFDKVNVPILGVVENMSHFVCDGCGKRHDIFGHGGARTEADRIGVPFLGEVPLELGIRLSSDAGTPVAMRENGTDTAYRDIASTLQAALSDVGGNGPVKILFE